MVSQFKIDNYFPLKDWEAVNKEKWIRKEGSKGSYNSAERGKWLKVSGSIRAKIKFKELRQLDACGATKKSEWKKTRCKKTQHN